VQAWCSGQAVQEPETARLSGESSLSFSGDQLVTEGARVDQVGEELSKRAVVGIVMCWPSESDHPLGWVSLACVIYFQVSLPKKQRQEH
jgi:hypothetical protein